MDFKKWMDGKKTYLTAAASIAYGILGLTLGDDPDKAMTWIMLGLGGIGIGHKLDKLAK